MMQRSSSSCSVFALLAATANALNTLTTTETSNGFNGPAMGWSTFGFQAINPTIPGWAPLVQSNVLEQCNMMASNSDLKGAGYKYCSLDSGWSADGADTYGRVLFQATNFPDFNTTFSKTLHDNGLLLGVYVVPGVIQSDVGKTIYKTDIKISDALQVQDGNHVDAGNDRYAFDYSKNGTQQWHDSVVALWASWGVDLIKLDYITPGSCNTNASYPACDLPGFPIDSSGTVEAYHTAIKNSGRPIRLDISWKLERNDTYYDIWRANADTMRMDQDINEGSGSAIFVKWATVQRAINNYREYIALQLPKNTPLSIYPDMDNMYVGNPAALSGVTDDQRTSIMSHWIGAAANLMIGSDLTALDTHGLALLTNPAALAVAAFTAQFPMQPRNPGSGSTSAQQLQAWIAGPAANGDAVVLLANYGPDEGQSGFSTSLAGNQTVSISTSDLGLADGRYLVRDVWAGTDEEVVAAGSPLVRSLGAGQSMLFNLTLVV